MNKLNTMKLIILLFLLPVLGYSQVDTTLNIVKVNTVVEQQTVVSGINKTITEVVIGDTSGINSNYSGVLQKEITIMNFYAKTLITDYAEISDLIKRDSSVLANINRSVVGQLAKQNANQFPANTWKMVVYGKATIVTLTKPNNVGRMSMVGFTNPRNVISLSTILVVLNFPNAGVNTTLWEISPGIWSTIDSNIKLIKTN